MVLLRETGKYLKPMLRDLEKPELVTKGVCYPGLYFPRVCDTSPLSVFRGPYHPIEWMMVCRGGATMTEINKWRGSLDALVDAARRWLYWPPMVAKVMFHLFTPFCPNADPAETKIVEIRKRLCKQFGVAGTPPTGWNLVWTYNYFWGQTVWGEIEL